MDAKYDYSIELTYPKFHFVCETKGGNIIGVRQIKVIKLMISVTIQASQRRLSTVIVSLKVDDYSPCIMCVQYIGGCSVHRGDIMSALGDVQYIGGYHDECGGYHEYIGGCSVHWRDTMSTSGDIMSTLVDIMSTSGDIMST